MTEELQLQELQTLECKRGDLIRKVLSTYNGSTVHLKLHDELSAVQASIAKIEDYLAQRGYGHFPIPA
jgi:hypothetical protein